MSVSLLLELLFGDSFKSKHMREKAMQFLYLLKEKKFVSVEEAKKFFEHRKTYYKVMRKFKEIGLVSLTKDVEGNFTWSLSLDAYKFFVKKNLIDDVEKVLK